MEEPLCSICWSYLQINDVLAAVTFNLQMTLFMMLARGSEFGAHAMNQSPLNGRACKI
jgi:hypothetical protein